APAHSGATTARPELQALLQHPPPRPAALPHPARSSPPHGDQVVHLSELRLCPWPIRRHREHNSLDLHAGVRGPPAPLRLVPGEPARALATPAVRVRAAQLELHGAVKTRAHGVG